MNSHHRHLLDLPNEILFLILKKLDNIDVLYSLLDMDNQRLDILAQQQIFSTILNFISISETNDEVCSIPNSMLDRFCASILPRIHENVKCLTIESMSMERILRAGDYTHLTELKLFNFNKEIVSRHFINDSRFRQICKERIANLTLVINENYIEETKEEYTKNVYAPILSFFENLKSLSMTSSFTKNYACFWLIEPSENVFSSSTLTKLCINVSNFADCLLLLDGRLKQLTTLIVQVHWIYNHTGTFHNQDNLPNFKCFSLTCYHCTEAYDTVILPTLRRMSHLEELTLYVHTFRGRTFVTGTDLDEQILVHMPRLHAFSFYIAFQNVIADPNLRVTIDQIERTFANGKYGQVMAMVDYFEPIKMICRVFSLPFKFSRLIDIGNNIPNFVFNTVTHVTLWDEEAFKHEFFVRLARAFPFLQNLSISNMKPPFWSTWNMPQKDWSSIIEYPYLTSLDVDRVNSYYVEQFLNDRKTRLPRLTELTVDYNNLRDATRNFTRIETQSSCARVKRLFPQQPMVHVENFHRYFPSLSI